MDRKTASRSGTTFVITEDLHSEIDGDFRTFGHALDELTGRVRPAFHEAPLLPPCLTGPDCERDYHVRAYDKDDPTKLVSEVAVVRVTAKSTTWAPEFLAHAGQLPDPR